PELPDRAPFVPEHADAEPAQGAADRRGVLPGDRRTVRGDRGRRLVRPGPSPPARRRSATTLEGVTALTLADYRARVAAMYLSDMDLAAFRAARDELFATHPDSAVEPDTFSGLRYFAPDDSFAATVPMRPADGALDIDTGGEDGVLH